MIYTCPVFRSEHGHEKFSGSATAALDSYSSSQEGIDGYPHPPGPQSATEVLNPLLSFCLIPFKCFILKFLNIQKSAVGYTQNLSFFGNLLILKAQWDLQIRRCLTELSNELSGSLFFNTLKYSSPAQLWPPKRLVVVKIFMQLQFYPVSAYLR